MVDNKEEPKIREGNELLSKLDMTELKPDSYFWYYISDENKWKLYISSKNFEKDSPLSNYYNFYSMFNNDPNINNIGISNIILAPEDSRLVSSLKKLAEVGRKRITDSKISDLFIDDIYIYRI